MAILVAAGGAALGTALGVGPGAGWLAGAAVGNLLFPSQGPDNRVEGPRLGDLTVTSSAYGAPIAIAYGTLRMAGNMIWSSGISEQRNVSRSSAGGKGGGGATQTAVSYSYTASFAIAFGEGPAEDVVRLWADGKLIYDKTGLAADVAKPGLRFRFHPGSETQLPDPLIEAQVGDGRAPAHRGLCYLVFEDLPLADFGNRIPNLTAEITFRREAAQPYQLLDSITTGEGGFFDSYQINEFAIDWHRGHGWFLAGGSDPASAGLRRFDLRTMRENRQRRMTDVTDVTPRQSPASLFCGRDSHLYLTVGSGNSRPIIRVEPDALREVGRFGFTNIGLTNTTTRFVTTTWFGMVSAYGPDGRVDFLLTGSQFDDIGLLRADGMAYVWGAGRTVDEPRVRGVIGGAVAEAVGEGWLLGSGTGTNHTSLGLYRIRVAVTAHYDPLTGQTLGVTFDKVASFTPEDIEPGATGFRDPAGALTWDATDDGVIFQIRVSHAGTAGAIYTVKWRTDVGIVWKTVVPGLINFEGPFFGQSRLEGQRWALMRSDRLVRLDTATGAVVSDETWPTEVNETGAQLYDAVSDTLLVRTGSGWARLFLGRGGGGGEPLTAIVGDLCGRAGLPAPDLDTTELDATVPGYVIGRQTTVRGAIEPLAQAFFFDAVESDDVLAFRRRGREPVVTIPAEHLLPLDERTAESWRERRTQEVELPERVAVVYMDKDADYQQGTQAAKRIALPLGAIHSRHQASLTLAMALQATTAKRIAEQTLVRSWVERSSFTAALPPDFLRLEPTDVVEVAFPSGSLFRLRLNRVDAGADFSLRLEGVAETAATYVSTMEADAGSGRPLQRIAVDAATRLILPDLPLLRDIDDAAGAGARLYYLLAGFGVPGWPGAALYRSADGSGWGQVGRALGEAAWGAAANALGEPRSPFSTDEENTLVVFMTTGGDRLESVTQEAMLNGANAAVLLKANGEPEVIQFRDVTLNPDGSFTLTGLLRGRRGTDVFVDDHQPGELFVLLDPDDVQTLTVPLGELGLARSWRAVGFGSLFEDAETVVQSHSGRDLMPLAPVHLTGSRNGASDLTIGWQRRTRIGGEWRNGTGTVPLGEASEAYEVDILDGPDGAVLRTLSALASPNAIYTAAAQTADFGAPQVTIHLRVVQLSATIGRGFPASASL